MEGAKAYQTFIALKLHFTSDYDYFKYQGKTRAIDDTKLSVRKDYNHFRKIERRYKDELVNYIVSGFVGNLNVKWVGDILTMECEKEYIEWKKKQEAFKYFFKLDMDKITEYNIKTMWEVVNGGHPQFLRLYLGRKLSLESLIAANEVLGFLRNWDDTIQDEIIWPSISRLMRKYRPFLNIDRNDIKNIMKDILL